METGMCSCDLESCDIYNERKVKARREHRCAECREPIKTGQKYIYLKSLYDGVWTTTKRCIPCQSIAVDYCCSIAEGGEVWACCREYLGVDLRTGETWEDWLKAF